MPIAEVAIPCPLYRTFDYSVAREVVSRLEPGMRVRVPFGPKPAVGVVVAVKERTEVPTGKLKPIRAVVDTEPLLPGDVMRLARWCATYYHAPLGEVLSAMMPVVQRRGETPKRRERFTYHAEAGITQERASAALSRAPKQRAILEAVLESEAGLSEAVIGERFENWRPACRELAAKGLIRAVAVPEGGEATPEGELQSPTLNDEQLAAVEAITAALGAFQTLLLEGVTASGKTEVYIEAVRRALDAGGQVLVLVPEIALTPQTLARFATQLGAPVTGLHSALADGERALAWEAARSGRSRVIVGTRSAVFVPMPELTLIVVDEEHDGSYCQAEGRFRYCARDVAILRARQCSVPVVLGSATPSLETLHHALAGQYQHLRLTRRARAVHRSPEVRLVDLRAAQVEAGLSETALHAIGERLDAGEQVLVFLNRRGFAPTLLCTGCGWIQHCERCDARMTWHRRRGRLICHHCGSERRPPPTCPECGCADLAGVGEGTQQLEAMLAARFPDHPVIRIDRDSTGRKGALDAALDSVRSGESRILVGTQMLAKGHDFDLGLVVVVGTDEAMFSADFRASERMAQLLVQVAGRAGRDQTRGTVLIQTHFPEHAVFQTLLQEGYGAFARAALAERQEAALPPFSHQALIRAESTEAHGALQFLEWVASAQWPEEIAVLGPAPAPMERKAGRYRAHLLLVSDDRGILTRTLGGLVPGIAESREARQVRWSVAKDPKGLD